MDQRSESSEEKIPMTEWFQTVEGEGSRAGFPTTFVRVYNCNLRCVWCDTKYSYAPSRPAFYASIEEIVEKVRSYGNQYVCLTGGEPLMHGEKSLRLIQALAEMEELVDVHIETNGSIHLAPFVELRNTHPDVGKKVRFIVDYKLPASGENHRMVYDNFALLEDQDEVKFVIADEQDFFLAKNVLAEWHRKGMPLFSPVWEEMPPYKLVALMLEHRLVNVKLSLQLHKIIWDPRRRGV